MKKAYLKYNQKGQALLLVLLGMAVVLVISLSIISRSLTDLSITSKDEDSLRAFSAAEAGVEEALLAGQGVGGGVGNASYDATIDKFYIDADEYNYPDSLKSGESATIWFVGHHDDGYLTCVDESGPIPCLSDSGADFRVCWGNESTDNASDESPAVEISVFYDTSSNSIGSSPDYSSVNVVRAVYDSKSTPRGNFAGNSGACTIADNDTYAFKTTNIFSDMGIDTGCLETAGCVLFARVKMLYNTSIDHQIGAVMNQGNFASQGAEVSSIGQSNNAVTKIQVIDTYKSPLSVFENAVFSPESIEK